MIRPKEMLNVEEKERIRRAVLVEGKSQRQVARETGHTRNTIRKMMENGEAPRYRQHNGHPLSG